MRGTLPEQRQRRKVRRADYAPPLPRVARVAAGGEEEEDLGFNRHARKPATSKSTLSIRELDVRCSPPRACELWAHFDAVRWITGSKALANAAIGKGEELAVRFFLTCLTPFLTCFSLLLSSFVIHLG